MSTSMASTHVWCYACPSLEETLCADCTPNMPRLHHLYAAAPTTSTTATQCSHLWLKKQSFKKMSIRCPRVFNNECKSSAIFSSIRCCRAKISRLEVSIFIIIVPPIQCPTYLTLILEEMKILLHQTAHRISPQKGTFSRIFKNYIVILSFKNLLHVSCSKKKRAHCM